jgi:hypothetical protein
MDELFSSLKNQLAVAEQEYNSLKAGRKSSAPRLRKSLMALKNDSHKLRGSTTLLVKGLPTKSRKVKQSEPKSEPVAEVVEIIPEPVAEVAVEPKKKKTRAKKVVSSPESLETSE